MNCRSEEISNAVSVDALRSESYLQIVPLRVTPSKGGTL